VEKDAFVGYAENAIARLEESMVAMRRKPSLFKAVVNLAMAQEQIYNMASAAGVDIPPPASVVAQQPGQKSKHPWDTLKERGDRFTVDAIDDGEKRKLAASLAVAANQKFGPGAVSVLKIGAGVLVVMRKK